jgi:RNA polymerase sigma-70 factor (sigma-E family)
MTSHEVGWTGMPAATDVPDAATDLAGLFRRHHGDLVRLATVLLRDRMVAEDVVQDVFTGIQARHDGVPRPDAAMPYLRAAVINRCRSAQRRQSVARRLGLQSGGETGLTEVSAETDVIRAEERREVLAALTALPPRRREVLVLRYYLGLSEAEIAMTLGISQGTVKSTAARGIAALAKALGEDA